MDANLSPPPLSPSSLYNYLTSVATSPSGPRAIGRTPATLSLLTLADFVPCPPSSSCHNQLTHSLPHTIYALFMIEEYVISSLHSLLLPLRMLQSTFLGGLSAGPLDGSLGLLRPCTGPGLLYPCTCASSVLVNEMSEHRRTTVERGRPTAKSVTVVRERKREERRESENDREKGREDERGGKLGRMLISTCNLMIRFCMLIVDSLACKSVCNVANVSLSEKYLLISSGFLGEPSKRTERKGG